LVLAVLDYFYLWKLSYRIGGYHLLKEVQKYNVEEVTAEGFSSKALQSEYPGYKFSWIEIEVKGIKEMLKGFPDFDLVMNKADGIGIKVSCNQAVVFIEVSGSPSKPDEKHIKDDAEKLLKEATFGLVSLLRNYLDKPAKMAKNVHIYMIQCIGDRITLSEFSLNGKYRYKTSQIKSARLPFSFTEIADYLEIFELLYALIDGLENQTKLLHELRLLPNDRVPKVRDWLWVPDTTASSLSIIYCFIVFFTAIDEERRDEV
ncbi:7851_t:CDS:2, partial [Paraglomus brasilianum]